MAFDFQPQTKITANEFGAVPASSTEQNRAAILNLRPTSRFYYIHHPDAWHCVETEQGFEWLPRLKCFRLTPGVNGVRQTRGKNPKPDDRQARVTLADRGFTIIPYDVIEGGYCWKYQGRRGAVYLERWAVPKQVGNRTIIKSDTEGFHKFGRYLIEAGHISKPDPDVLQMLMDLQEQSLERDAANTHIPAVAARHAENTRHLDGMRQAFDELFAPKKKPAKKSTKADK
jgi:hypothetical protein